MCFILYCDHYLICCDTSQQFHKLGQLDFHTVTIMNFLILHHFRHLLTILNQVPTSQSNKDLFENINDKVVNTMANETAKSKSIVDEEILKTLTSECRYFHDLVLQMLSNDSAINAIQVNKDLFTYDEDFEIHITMDDIIQFFSMKWLNASWLQLYIM